jgi:hypothetical protein
MKPIEFVKVDACDGRPATEYPTRHGPADPVENITILWWEGNNPAHYFGLVANDRKTDVPGVLREIDTEEWAKLIEQRREARLQELADHRWRIETGGVTLPDGARILTDRESQAQLTSAYQSLTQPFVDSIEWKAADGWVTVTEAELRPIAQAVAQHVQACFTAERQVSDQIAAAEGAEALHAINIRQAFEEALSGA